jgi:hypothetical protein
MPLRIGRDKHIPHQSAEMLQANQEELERLSDAEVNALELTNHAWLKKFAKARALWFLNRMKNLNGL